MPELSEVWKQALPEIRRGVTGVGVWAALNGAVPLLVEDGTLVLGLPSEESELSGHLRIPQTRKLIEQEISARWDGNVNLRVIDGTSVSDWERVKRRDLEARRLQEVAEGKARAEIAARTSWESVYESLSRKFAAMPNKSMPMNRAKFYAEGIAILADARKNQPVQDELGQRNFGRCIERLAQYSEVPSTIVALHVMEKTGEV